MKIRFKSGHGQMLQLFKCCIQRGSEIWPFEIQKLLKSGLFEGRALPTIRKLDHSKSGQFSTKLRPFVWISNGWTLGFQIPFEIWTIGNPTSFWRFKIQTTPDFRSPLYSDRNVINFTKFHFKSQAIFGNQKLEVLNFGLYNNGRLLKMWTESFF